MLEIEMKFAVPAAGDLASRLAAMGARQQPILVEVDHYFNAPDRDFATTDEAFRIRRIGSANYLTYKGPRTDRVTKTREEIEVPIGAGDAVAQGVMQLFTRLGYRPVAVVRKERQCFELDRGRFQITVCLDSVDRVGRYAELEILAPQEDLEAAKKVLHALASELGLEMAERRSYLELLLTARG